MSFTFFLFYTAPELVPSLCVTASITPSISPVVSGSTVTLTCLVYSDIGLLKTNVTIIHEMTNGTIRELQPQQESTPNFFQYISLLHNVTSEDHKGNYTCIAVIKEFNIEVHDSVTLKISETFHSSIFTTSHPKSSTPYLTPSSSFSSNSTRHSTQMMMESVKIDMSPYISHTSTNYLFTSFHTLSVTSSSLTTSPTQVLQSKDINDIALILVTIVSGLLLIIVVVLIIIIFLLVGKIAILESSQRTYEVNHKMEITNIITTTK